MNEIYQPDITPHLSTYEILNHWPEAAMVFLEHKMSCVGCYMSVFDTLEDAAIVHDIPVEVLLRSLHQRIQVSDPADEGRGYRES